MIGMHDFRCFATNNAFRLYRQQKNVYRYMEHEMTTVKERIKNAIDYDEALAEFLDFDYNLANPSPADTLEILLLEMQKIGIKKHGRIKWLAEKTGYSRTQVGDVLGGRTAITTRFLRIANSAITDEMARLYYLEEGESSGLAYQHKVEDLIKYISENIKQLSLDQLSDINKHIHIYLDLNQANLAIEKLKESRSHATVSKPN